MRKLLLAAFVSLLFIAPACDNTKTAGATDAEGMTEQEKKNLEASKTIYEAFKNNEPAKLDTVVAADFVDHTDMGDKVGIDSMKKWLNMIHTQMENLNMEVKNRWANGDYVMEQVHYTGTVKPGTPGMPPGDFDIMGMELTRFNNESKAVEHWFYWDSRSMAKMMEQSAGHMNSSSAQTNKTDAAKPDTSKPMQ